MEKKEVVNPWQLITNCPGKLKAINQRRMAYSVARGRIELPTFGL
jgi:hypothetical protein